MPVWLYRLPIACYRLPIDTDSLCSDPGRLHTSRLSEELRCDIFQTIKLDYHKNRYGRLTP